MEKMTYDEVMAYCEGKRESDGFCSVCCSCSGPTYSNLAWDYPQPEGITIMRGGNHGSCYFEVEE